MIILAGCLLLMLFAINVNLLYCCSCILSHGTSILNSLLLSVGRKEEVLGKSRIKVKDVRYQPNL